MAAKPETPVIWKIVGEHGPAAGNSQARTVAWAKFRPETKPALRKDGRSGFLDRSSFQSHFLSFNPRQSLSPISWGRGGEPEGLDGKGVNKKSTLREHHEPNQSLMK
jgi:hypothetical protein